VGRPVPPDPADGPFGLNRRNTDRSVKARQRELSPTPDLSVQTNGRFRANDHGRTYRSGRFAGHPPVANIIRTLTDIGEPLSLIRHDMRQVLDLVDRSVVFRCGRIVADPRKDEAVAELRSVNLLEVL
jgi:hypothetical protein